MTGVADAATGATHKADEPGLLGDGSQGEEYWSSRLESGRDLSREVEGELFEAISKGHLASVASAIGKMPRPRPLLLELLELEAAVRSQSARIHRVDALRKRIKKERPEWMPWLTVLHAEHFLWLGSMTSLTVAGQVDLDATTARSDGRWEQLTYCRLLRLRAFADAASENNALSGFEPFGKAIIGFEQLECYEEAAASWLLAAFLIASMDRTVAGEMADATRPSLERIWELGSDRRVFAALSVGWIYMLARRLDECRACIDRADAVGSPPPSGFLRAIRKALGGVVNLIEEGPRAGQLDALIDAVTYAHERGGMSFGMSMYVAGLLLDHGLTEEAAQILPPLAEAAAFPAIAYYDSALAHARLAFLSYPSSETLEALDNVIDECIEHQPERRVAGALLRVSGDCGRRSRDADAEKYRERALAILPENREEWTGEERERADSRPAEADVTPAGELRLIGPDLLVTRWGNPVHIGDVAAKFLVLLALRQQAVTTDWIVEALWPEIDMERGKSRLKWLIYRIRQALELNRGEFLVRTDYGAELQPAPGWRVDVWEFRRLAHGTDADRKAACEIYSSDVCFRQFAYDDQIEMERDAFREEYERLSAEVSQES